MNDTPEHPGQSVLRYLRNQPHASDIDSIYEAISGINAGLGELSRFFEQGEKVFPRPPRVPGEQVQPTSIWENCRHEISNGISNFYRYDQKFTDPDVKKQAMLALKERVELTLPMFDEMREHVAGLENPDFDKEEALKYLDGTKLAVRTLAQRLGRVAIGQPARNTQSGGRAT